MSIQVTTEEPYDWEDQKPRIVVTLHGDHVGDPVTIAYTQDRGEAIAKMEALIVEARRALRQIKGIE